MVHTSTQLTILQTTNQSTTNMFSTKVSTVLFMALVSLATSMGEGGPLLPGKGYFAYPKYSYSYGVNDALTGDHKTASETRDGGVVKGSYSLVQPDGVLRTVEYVADPIHGFQAKVINSAPGVHAVKVAPAYAAKPLVGGYGHAGGFGHGGGYGHAAAVVKPAAVAYTQSVGPLAYGGGHLGGGLGYGGQGVLAGYGGFHGGY